MRFRITDAFAAGVNAKRNWNAFLRRTAPTLPPPDFPALVASVRAFLEPALRKLRGETLAEMRWTPAAGWQLATS